jgi:nucleoside-diphosphate-sugar epimerase
MQPINNILVIGGAGYVGCILVPKLVKAGYAVTVLDTFWYWMDGREIMTPRCLNGAMLVKGDVRDGKAIQKAMKNQDAVIHLACISNDPSFELDPALGKSINYDAFRPLVEAARDNGVRRFVYASSSSVYGSREDIEVVDEDTSLKPISDYSQYKGMTEAILEQYQSDDFCTTILRPGTVCGYSPRMRLDLVVNIFTNHAWHNGVITVNGGHQKRPGIHIEDMTDLYMMLMKLPEKLSASIVSAISGKVWNAAYGNYTLNELAQKVATVVGKIKGETVEIKWRENKDARSYHVSSERIWQDIGFRASRTVEEAVGDVCHAFDSGKIPDAMTDGRYYNVKKMGELRIR